MPSQQRASKESTNKPLVVSKEPFLKDGSKEVPQPPKPQHRKHANVTCEKDLESDPGYAKLIQKLKDEGTNVTDKLGSGSYSVVLKAITADGKKVAVKIICTRVKNDYVGRFLPRGMKIVPQLQHPHVLRFYTVRDNRTCEPDLPFVVFMTEWAEGGDLLKKIKNIQNKGQKGMSEPDMRTTFRQLIDGLEYLDQKHIVHRDLKCENIMLDAHENVKIGDFGFTRVLHTQEKSKTFCGSRAYVAPEIILAKSYRGRPVDVWSVGIIMYVSTTGHFPFDERDPQEMITEQHRVRFSRHWSGSKPLRAIIMDALHPLPDKRPSYQELLSNEFLKNGPGRAWEDYVHDEDKYIPRREYRVTTADTTNILDMATTKENVSTSATLRRLIDATSARLQRALSSIKSSTPSFTPMEADLIIDQYDELDSLHKSVLKPFSKLQDLHQTWLRLMDSDNEEKAIFYDFVERRGDYTKLLTQAVSTLEHLDTQLHAIETNADAMNVIIPTSPAQSIIGDVFSPSSDASDSAFIKKHLPQNLAIAQPPGIFPSKDALPRPPNLAAEVPGTFCPLVTAPNSTNPRLPDGFVLPTGFSTPIANHSSGGIHGYNPHLMQFADSNALTAALISRLDVPSFNGSIIDFPEFWTRFHALVDCRQGIDPGSKFSLLKSCLRGHALDCVQGIPVTGDNYSTAIALLHNMYNEPATIRHLLYSRLINLPPCDEKTLRPRFSEMNSLVRQLSSHDPLASSEFALAAALINKLPRDVRGRVLDKTPTKTNLTPLQLLAILEEIVHKEFRLEWMTPSEDIYHCTNYDTNGRPPPAPNLLDPCNNHEEQLRLRGSVADDAFHDNV